MRSVERRFNEIQRKNPLWGSIPCLSSAVQGQRFSKRQLSHWFRRLVDTSDYDQRDRRSLINQLEDCTNTGENTIKRPVGA